MKEKVTPKSFFLPSPVANKKTAFPLTEASAFEVPAILKKNKKFETTILKLYLATRPGLHDVITSGSRPVISQSVS